MRIVQNTLAIVVTSLFLAACAHGGTKAPAARDARQAGYLVTIDDILEVHVFKEPELSTTVPVRPDGRIAVPGVGEMVVEGKTPRQIAGEITQALSRTVTSPVVSVSIKERGGRVYVLGEVTRPGAYPLAGELTVLQALAIAGGLTEFADGDEITVLRRESGKQVKYRFDYGDAVGGGNPFQLAPGDTIVVP
jgi:polysaccharide export outer membrane protein